MTEEGRRLLAAATGGPWYAEDMTGVPDAYGFLRGVREAIFGREPDGTRPGVAPVVFGHANAALIVAAVNQYAGLLDLWEAAIGTVARIDGAQDPTDPALADLLRGPLAALQASRDSTPDPLE